MYITFSGFEYLLCASLKIRCNDVSKAILLRFLNVGKGNNSDSVSSSRRSNITARRAIVSGAMVECQQAFRTWDWDRVIIKGLS